MGLRDIVLMIAVYGSLPFILHRPFIGVLVWYWLALMNPHRISWTLARQPFAQLVALTLLASLLINVRESKHLPLNAITITLALFWVWMLITTLQAFYPQLAWLQWDKVWRIMLTTYIAILLVHTKERLIALTAVMTAAIAFFGVKGGFFTILTGGSQRVWGPPGSFIGGNNEMGLALIMSLPYLSFLRTINRNALVRHLLLLALVLCLFAILGTQSRGAFVGLLAVAGYLALKSPNKIAYITLALVLAPVAYSFMPDSWHERMATIQTYEEDASAMGRIVAWQMSWNLAQDRLTGGGFETFQPSIYLIYLPEAGARRTVAHSIYFGILAEHGFIGLGLFMALLFFAFRACRVIIRKTRERPDLHWMNYLARMTQVSLVGYAASGAFLSLGYFNYFYALLVLIVGMQTILTAALQAPVPEPEPEPESAGTSASQSAPLGSWLSPAFWWRWAAGWYRRL